MRILTARELNRSLLSRQLLLERSSKSVIQALEAVGGLQTQNATGGYIGLWTRLEKFQMADLTKALEDRRAVQGTMMRITIHLVSAGDYPFVAAGTRSSRRAGWLRYHQGRVTESDVKKAATAARKALANGPLSRKDLKPAVDSSAVWNGVNALYDVLRVPPSGTWERRRADIYAMADDWLGPIEASEEQGLELLLKRYLGGFGPARLADAANWAGVAAKKLQPATEKLNLRHFEDEEGKELLDLPRAPIPDAKTPAPARYLPVWDAILLAHARRAEILAEEYRPLIFTTKTPQSVNTFLVDGAVAGKWSVKRTAKKAELLVEPFEKLPPKAKKELEAEGERLVRFHEPDAESHTVRLAGSA
ncbi:MAG TPA: winged helix DNA-binding domain-containing protein [Gaiellaceae bacterium]|nr:winged helix DNA-binding domain-containing protein [Gaiellaceae bacterium]